MVDFHEVSLPSNFLYGAGINIEYRTAIVQVREGQEQRNVNWFDPLMNFDISNCIRDQADLDFLIAFFRSRGGSKFGFRVKDFLDFSVTDEFLGTGDGVRVDFQLRKEYATGVGGDSATEIRPITKPVSGTVTVEVDAVPTAVTVDTTTGVVSFAVAPAGATNITWSGDFDVPVRFETDELVTEFRAFEIRRQPVRLLEIRIPLTIPLQWTDPEITEFVEARFFDVFSSSSGMGPSDNVEIIRADSGYENRIPRWLEKRVIFNLRENVQTNPEISFLRDLFRSKKARAVGFRVKDISDFSVTSEPFGTGNDLTDQFQLIKTYSDAGGSEVRDINKPVDGTVVVSASPATTIVPTVDSITGLVTYTLGNINVTFDDATDTITRNDAGNFVTDGVTAADTVTVIGSTNNDANYTIASVAATVLTLDAVTLVDDTETVELRIPPQNAVALTWTGEFDVPVRFETDEFSAVIEDFDVHNWNDAKLIEIRTQRVAGLNLVGQTGKLTAGPTGCNVTSFQAGNAGNLALKFGAGQALRAPNGLYSDQLWNVFATTWFMVVSEPVGPGDIIYVPGPREHTTFEIGLDSSEQVTTIASAGQVALTCNKILGKSGDVANSIPRSVPCYTFVGTPVPSPSIEGNLPTPLQGGQCELSPEEPFDPDFPTGNSDLYSVKGNPNIEEIVVVPPIGGVGDSGPGRGEALGFRGTPVRASGNSEHQIDTGSSRVSIIAVTCIYTGDQIIHYGHLDGNKVGGTFIFGIAEAQFGATPGLFTNTPPGQLGISTLNGFGSERAYHTSGSPASTPLINGRSTISTDVNNQMAFFLHEMIFLTHRGSIVTQGEVMIQSILTTLGYLEFKWRTGVDPGYNPGPHLGGWWLPTSDTVFDNDLMTSSVPQVKSSTLGNATLWKSINETRFNYTPQSISQNWEATVTAAPALNQSPTLVDMGEIKTIDPTRVPLKRPDFYSLYPGFQVTT